MLPSFSFPNSLLYSLQTHNYSLFSDSIFECSYVVLTFLCAGERCSVTLSLVCPCMSLPFPFPIKLQYFGPWRLKMLEWWCFLLWLDLGDWIIYYILLKKLFLFLFLFAIAHFSFLCLVHDLSVTNLFLCVFSFYFKREIALFFWLLLFQNCF